MSRHLIVYRMALRLSWSLCLFTVLLPGLLLWTPVFATTFYAVHNFKKTGPIFDTWDEIAQYKLVYGLISGICVWLMATVLTLPVAPITFFAIPTVMWLTLRWVEDAVSSFRAFISLFRLLIVGKPTLAALRNRREGLHERVKLLAERLNLPPNPEEYFAESGGQEKGKIRGYWDSNTRYFSLRRRRKRDWNETLRLYDKVDYPVEDF
jgi:glycerol-3-phosphate O-acyltransferase / dihydroxyacetone phosphate acyltransferase